MGVCIASVDEFRSVVEGWQQERISASADTGLKYSSVIVPANGSVEMIFNIK